MFCTKCGTQVDLSGKFCTKCGNNLESYPHSGSIIFARQNQFYGVIIPIDIFMDGVRVAPVNAGREIKIPATIGTHKMAFNLWSGNGQFDIEITNANPNIKVTFKLGVGAVTSKPKIVSIENV